MIEGTTTELIATLNATDREKRLRAAEALGERGDPQAVAPLITAATVEYDRRLTLVVIEALGKIGDASAFEVLLKILRDWKTEDFRGAAAQALGKTGKRQAVEPLKAVLMDETGALWTKSVVEALGTIGDPAALEVLMGSLYYPNRCAAAIEALGKLKDARAVEGLAGKLQNMESHYDPDTAKKLGAALEQFGSAAVEALVRVVQHGDFGAKRAAIKALGNIGDARAEEILLSAVRDPSSYVRWEAVDAMGKIGGDGCVGALATALTDEDHLVRMCAGRALTKLGWQPSDAAQSASYARAIREREEHFKEEAGIVSDHESVDPDWNVNPNARKIAARLTALKVTDAYGQSNEIQIVSLRVAARRIMRLYRSGLDPHKRPNRDRYHLGAFGDHISCFSPSYGEISSSGIDVYKVVVPLRLLGFTLASMGRVGYLIHER
jgi:HEAT repeat protein